MTTGSDRERPRRRIDVHRGTVHGAAGDNPRGALPEAQVEPAAGELVPAV